MPASNDTKVKYDFGGYVTVYNVECKDGRVILPSAFAHYDSKRVPLMWQHNYDSPENVLGFVDLEHRPEKGLYGRVSVNKTARGLHAKEAVKHGDISGFSIFANRLTQQGKFVKHGQLIEASLVMLGQNPGAYIDDTSFAHGDGEDGSEAMIAYVSEDGVEIFHDDTAATDGQTVTDQPSEPAANTADQPPAEPTPVMELSEKGKEIIEALKSGTTSLEDAMVSEAEYFNSVTDEERKLFYELLGGAAINLVQGEINMRIFNSPKDNTGSQRTNVLTHDDVMNILSQSGNGKFKDAVLRHADTYGFKPIDLLLPRPTTQPSDPIVIQRQQAWVASFFGGAFKSPIARVRSLYADISKKEARARGYITGNMKYEQVIELLQRETTPTTVYAKQKLDRDDAADITEYAVFEFLWKVMEQSLNEELALAGLLGDGRLIGDPDKINESKIRPVYKDHPFFAHRIELPATVGPMNPAEWLKMIDAVAQARRFYRGSGNPTFYTTPEFLADITTLREPTTGMRYFATDAELKAQMRVSDIVEVPQMEAVARVEGADTFGLVGIVMNPADYTFGATPVGQYASFQDFDIDHNQHKLLMETRRSGGLTLPKSALIIEKLGWSTSVTPALPTDIDDSN